MTPIFTSFDTFVASTVGLQFGNGTAQDYINLLWEHLGSVYYTASPSAPDPTTQGVKNGWLDADARNANTISHLTQVTTMSGIKKGDVVVLSDGANGFAGFADEDYNGSVILKMCSQNYSVAFVKVENVDISNFLGGWRYDAWGSTPPEPPVLTRGKSKFKWTIYSRKLREKRRGL